MSSYHSKPTPSFYKRRQSKPVFVGNIGVGGNNPIRLQSMTVSDTKDTVSTVNEIQDLVNAGCEIVRLTVPTKLDCANLKNIRKELAQKQIKCPIVADIHFTPSIAMDVVDFVEKVRINPGNFIDKKLFKTRDYTDTEYQSEIDRIEERFTPLVLKCKEKGVAMRIGTNHGSLSDRIMNRYGDSPQGMVESALEFLRIAAKNNYNEIILSMKAANTQVMITAYRLLNKRLKEENMAHPFHLGVTEAGEGEDARIKSAVGIGTLLHEGLGDTIRVSLTEDSIHEIPVAGAIASPYNKKFYIDMAQNFKDNPPTHLNFLNNELFNLNYERRKSHELNLDSLSIGKNQPVRIWGSLDSSSHLKDLSKALKDESSFEGIEISTRVLFPHFIEQLKELKRPLSLISENINILREQNDFQKLTYIIKKPEDYRLFFKAPQSKKQHYELCFDVSLYPLHAEDFTQHLAEINNFDKNSNNIDISFSLISNNIAQDYKILAQALKQLNMQHPIHLRYHNDDYPILTEASAQLGSLLTQGIGDSIQIEGCQSIEQNQKMAYGILQACRIRLSKTEFIACPSCGRTLFDLQKVTAQIKAKTDHLIGVKIAIMGCIVNGPGEMADADFGYVGTGVGKISLYVGKECVQKNIPEEQALDQLIELIKQNERWQEAA
ncbi:hypothetical protein BVY03_02130 [bacterium K02(2017)]|nr:hypothetical protein BVY03_02130 [bacterium K02(2017)]